MSKSKKISIPSYILRTKWLVVLLVTLFLVVLGRTIESPALTQTAIVLGIGLDHSASEGYTVSTQSVLVSGNSAEGSSQNSYATYTETGVTISQALDSISRKMGLTISLAHCNVLYLSQQVLKLNHLNIVDALTGMYSLPEQALVVSGEETPDKLLSARIATTVSAPFFLQTMLVKHEGSDGITRTTVKDFMARTLSRSSSNVIPYISLKQQPDDPLNSQGEQSGNMEYVMKSSLAFNSKQSVIIPPQYAEILAIYLSKEVVGTLNYTFPTGESIEFRILDTKLSAKAKKRKIQADLELSVSLIEAQYVDTTQKITSADKLVTRAADELAKELCSKLEYLFDYSKQCKIDFLNLQNKAYQSVGRTLEHDCLDTLQFTPKVKLSIAETS